MINTFDFTLALENISYKGLKIMNSLIEKAIIEREKKKETDRVDREKGLQIEVIYKY